MRKTLFILGLARCIYIVHSSEAIKK